MATNQVNPVNVTISTLTSGDIEKEMRENEKRSGKKAGVDVAGDSVTVKTSASAGTSTAGEAKPPVKATAHQGLKHARSVLLTALKNAGAAVRGGTENLIEKGHQTLDSLDSKITTMLEKGGKEEEVVKFERQREEIIDALSAYEVLQAEAGETPSATVQSASASENAGSSTGGTQTQGGENYEALWVGLDRDLKTVGVSIGANETDLELAQNKIAAQFSKELNKFKEKESELATRKKDLEIELKAATTPADKARVEKELKAVDAELQTVLRDKKDLQVAFLRVHETLMHFQAANDLGMAPKNEPRSTTVRSASANQKKTATASTASAQGAGGASQTSASSAGGSGGGVSINTASAGGGSSYVTDQGDASGAGLLSTESAGAGDASAVTTNAFNDFTGTTLAIASTGSTLKGESRKTEEALKKLLRAALSGNYEAIKTALILLDKRASQTVISMGASTIKAMQNYEKQMATLTKSMEKLKADGNPSYNAQLAKINSEMNMYSMNRQAIANFLRDTMNMREEIGNLTHGFISKDGQIGSALSRWG